MAKVVFAGNSGDAIIATTIITAIVVIFIGPNTLPIIGTILFFSQMTIEHYNGKNSTE
ncbi:MAG UNVERIFIED_CONTAM: hypothetical protein LVQ98_02800 [Rickettsiaceae bacterium]